MLERVENYRIKILAMEDVHVVFMWRGGNSKNQWKLETCPTLLLMVVGPVTMRTLRLGNNWGGCSWSQDKFIMCKD